MDWIVNLYQQLMSDPETLKLISIPFISAASGWLTNWFAIKLTLYPTKPIPITPWFGWQGILPAKSKKMAGILMDKTIVHLGSLQDIFREMEPHKIAEYLQEDIQKNVEIYVDETMEEIMPVAWANTPLILKKRFYRRVVTLAPTLANNMLEDIEKNLDQLLDLNEMVVQQLTDDPALLVRIFKEIGETEMKFGVNSGFWFGLLFGCIQMYFWSVYPEAWVLPFFGALVGTSTNWVVINVIFRPLNPVTVLPGFNLGFIKTDPIILQGLFLKRQQAVAGEFSRILTTEVMSVSRFMGAMMTGKNSKRAKLIIKSNLRPYVESGVAKMVLQLSVGFENYVKVKDRIQDKAINLSLNSLNNPRFNSERGAVVSRFFTGQIRDMSPADYQDMLRPAFEEDEWIILVMGAVLGGLVGFAQFIYIFA